MDKQDRVFIICGLELITFNMSEENIVEGPPIWGTVYAESFGQRIFESLKRNSHVQQPVLHDITNEKTISFKELLQTSCKLSRWLIENGCETNDIIAVCSENSTHFFKPVFAALYNGTTVALINNMYTEDELLHALSLVKPKIVFCSKQTLNIHLKLCRSGKLPGVRKICVLEEIDTYISRIEVDERLFEVVRVNTLEQPAVILYSSGTTGLSKGVIITHDNINTQLQIARDPLMTADNYPKDSFVPLPFFHAYGFFATLSSIDRGAHIMFLQKFDFDLYLRTLEKYKVSMVIGVPTLLVLFAKSPLIDKYDLSCVQKIRCGAAPLSKKIMLAIQKRLNNVKINEAYGMTESTLGVISARITEDPPLGSIGKVVPGIKIKIRDLETGKSLGPNSPGELCAKGRLIMKGYHNNPEATKAAFEDGWLLTGDVAYYDNNGYFYIVDRLKELIKYKGFQVAPAELESVLLSHPKILDAAVVGLPDEIAGEVPIAFVVKAPNADLTELQVQDYVKGQVADWKQLRGGVRFINIIPKNPTGKILRKELRKLLQKLPSKL